MTSPTTDDLAAFLGSSVDDPRAQLMLDLATELCESVVSPLPDTARSVILSVAARAYTNVQNAQSQTVGPFATNFGSAGSGGLYLTRQDRATLRRLSGGGGAFMIDTMPATAGQNLSWWDTGVVGPADCFDTP